MFSDEEKNLYRSITAPDGLYQKIIAKQRKPKKALYAIAAMAACLVLIVSGVIMNTPSSIVVNGQKLKDSVEFYVATSTLERTVSSTISVPVELDVNCKTEISVNDGLIRIEGGEPSKKIEINSSDLLWWEIEPKRSAQEFEMLISSQKGVQKVSLKYENAKIKVTRE